MASDNELLIQIANTLRQLTKVAETQEKIVGDLKKAQDKTTKEVSLTRKYEMGRGNNLKPWQNQMLSFGAKNMLWLGGILSAQRMAVQVLQKSETIHKEALARGSTLSKVMQMTGEATARLSESMTGYIPLMETTLDQWSSGLRRNNSALDKLGVATKVTSGQQKQLFKLCQRQQ